MHEIKVQEKMHSIEIQQTAKYFRPLVQMQIKEMEQDMQMVVVSHAIEHSPYHYDDLDPLHPL